ncbi:MAG: sigma-70 family RNA polymerase sigma factor [Opitutaceae bacterium]|nr:sigma-70 family RNA polymerase sigma factor [Opitutaceae bacterium]
MIRRPITSTAQTDPASGFEPHRRHLLAVAYRFLGSVSDAEDIVQETYLRWAAAGAAGIREPRGYLTRITAHLCLDQLKSARVRRERYVGPWLPEPIVEAAGFSTGPADDRTDDISVALMLALERLSPLERAAFVLHDAFGQSFDEVAAALDRTSSACRQLAARARKHLRTARPRFAVPPGEGERLVEAFLRATQSGDLAGLTRLLTADAVLHSDSGGKVRSARRLILGADRIARLFATLTRKYGPPHSATPARINGLPGLLMLDYNNVTQTLAFEIRDGAIATLYLIRNPDKLRHVRPPSNVLTHPTSSPAA